MVSLVSLLPLPSPFLPVECLVMSVSGKEGEEEAPSPSPSAVLAEAISHTDSPNVESSVQNAKDSKGLLFSAVGDSALRSLSRQLKEIHKSLGCDVLFKARQLGPENDETRAKDFPCSGKVVETWSSNFRALLKEVEKDTHGCQVIQLQGSPEVVEDAIAFMKEGRCSFAVMDLNQPHPLLAFASEYGLDDLKVTYGEAMMCQNPVTLQNSSFYLELGLKYSVFNLSLVAADLLAANVGPLDQLNKVILNLDSRCFKAVLASDALNVEREEDTLTLIKMWLAQVDEVDGAKAERSASIDAFLLQVRLSLCSYQALIDLMSSLGTDLWHGVDEDSLRSRVRKVIDEKLQGMHPSDRRRHQTKLPCGENEERLATTLKVSKCLYAS